MLSSKTIDIVKACIPLLETSGEALVAHFYQLLMREPGMAAMFNSSNQGGGQQVKALASAVLAYARNIENPAALLPAVDRIAAKHVALNVTPEQYQVVGGCLLQALRDVANADDEVVAAWAEAYGLLAGIFIDYEAKLYAEKAGAPGGWRGVRRFRIDRIEAESAVARSFYLVPSDGQPLMPYKPGQYLTLHLDLPGGPQHRHYSLSRAFRSDAYRITVKREEQGAGSGFLHGLSVGTELDVSAPAGEFVLDESATSPVVLLSGGIGVTPVFAMLDALQSSPRPLVWLHAARDGGQHSLKRQVQEILAVRPAAEAHIWYESPGEGDTAGSDFHHAGRIDPAAVAGRLPKDATVYLCGPDDFMTAMRQGLQAAGFAADQVKSERFKPTVIG